VQGFIGHATMTTKPGQERSLTLLSSLAAAVLLILPFAHTVALRHVLTALVLVATAVQFRRLLRVPRMVHLALWCWLAFSLASTLWSIDALRTAEAWLDEALYPSILFYAFYAASTHVNGQIRLQVATVVGITALAALSAFGYHAISVDTVRPGLLYYYPGVGQASSYAVFALPVLALIVRTGRWPVMGVIGLFACVVIGAASLNRMFWPTALLTLLCAVGFHFRSGTMKVLLGATAIAAAIVAIGLVYQVRNGTADTKENSDVEISVESVQRMLDSDPRREIWRAFTHAVFDAPWIGLGFGKTVPHVYYKAHHLGNPILSGSKAWEHAHNLFLNTILQTGIVGLALFVGLLFALAWAFTAARTHAPAAAWAGLALLLALILKNTTDDFMRDAMAMYYWGLAGWLLALATRPGVPDQT
jgi:O-antigen ligase